MRPYVPKEHTPPLGGHRGCAQVGGWYIRWSVKIFVEKVMALSKLQGCQAPLNNDNDTEIALNNGG